MSTHVKSSLTQERKNQQLLYLQYYGWALRKAYRYMADYTCARTMVDETFLRLFRSVTKAGKKAGTGGAFANCLGDSLVRAIVARLVQQQTGVTYPMQRTAATAGITETPIWTDTPASGYPGESETVLYRDLITLLVSLPPDLRMVYNLRVIDGYSAKETARLLHIEKKEVDCYVSKARSLLRSTALLFYKI